MTSPTTPRVNASDSTSIPEAKATLAKVSPMPNEVAAMMPGTRAVSRSRAFPDCIFRSAMDQRAGAEFGKQFEQHRVRHLAIKDDDAFDPLLQRIDAGFDLRDHAARNGAVGDQPPRIVDRQLLDQHLRLVEHTGNVGE